MASMLSDSPDVLDGDNPSAPPSPTRRPPSLPNAVVPGTQIGLGQVVGMVDAVMVRVPWWMVLAGGAGVGWWAKKRWGR